MIKVEVTSAPSVDPLTVAEAKAHLRVDHTTDDSYIESLIKAARVTCENFQNRAYITQTRKLYLDDFPGVNCPIELPFAPLQSVSSLTYVDTDGTTQTWATSNYQVDTKAQPGTVEPVDGVTYPLVYPNKRNAVIITYICGYGATSASVPESARHAMRLLISDWYNQREDTVIGNIVNSLPMGVEALLWQDRIYTF
jgi:uncharacterized phiE125 gp8 family phage protein